MTDNETSTGTGQAQAFAIIGPAEVWQGMLESRYLVGGALLVSLVIGLLAAYLPVPSYTVSARLLPPSAVEVQQFRAQFAYHDAIAPAFMIQNLEVERLALGGREVDTVDILTTLVFQEYLRNLVSVARRADFVETYNYTELDGKTTVSDAVSGVRFDLPRKATEPLVVTVTMTTSLQGDAASRLLNDYLAYLDRTTRQELAAAVEKRRQASGMQSAGNAMTFTADDLAVVVFDRPAVPPTAPHYPNRKLVITLSLLIGLFLGTLLSTIRYVRKRL